MFNHIWSRGALGAFTCSANSFIINWLTDVFLLRRLQLEETWKVVGKRRGNSMFSRENRWENIFLSANMCSTVQKHHWIDKWNRNSLHAGNLLTAPLYFPSIYYAAASSCVETISLRMVRLRRLPKAKARKLCCQCQLIRWNAWVVGRSWSVLFTESGEIIAQNCRRWKVNRWKTVAQLTVCKLTQTCRKHHAPINVLIWFHYGNRSV